MADVDRVRSPLLRAKTHSAHGTFAVGHPSSDELEVRAADRRPITLHHQLREVLCTTWPLKTLLLFVPGALFGAALGFSQGALFVCSFFGLIPLAALLGDFTEDIALRSNDIIGALINVTFGNATELVISIMALRAGLYDLIKLSLIGSVLGNMLLVLGTAFFVGGVKYKVLVFNARAAQTYSPLLVLSVMSFVVPSGFNSLRSVERDAPMLHVSRQIAAVTVVVYAAYLFFQLYTHKHFFDDASQPNAVEMTERSSLLGMGQRSQARAAQTQRRDEDEDEEEDEGPSYSLAFAVAGLAVVSIILSVLSEVLVNSLEPAALQWNLPAQFISIILVPIVGNAAEHASAILMALKNKTDIAIGVAIGSSIQIALFVMPLLVLLGWAFNIPLDMNFHPFPTALVFVAVLVTNHTTSDGISNWLEGLMLVAAYVMVALTFMNATFKV